MSLRVLIVDDEDLARARLRRLLRDEPDVVVAGEAADGERALDAIERLRPDAMFLDVQMPVLDGFGVLRACEPGATPLVVFVTAWEEHAVRAFEVNAVDYLLKPYSPRRVKEATRRLVERRQAGPGAERERLRALLAGLAPASRGADRLLVPTTHGSRVVRCRDIDWISAADNYVELHVGDASHLLRETLASLEPRLDPRQFQRIHRSTIVNVTRVRELRALFAGDAELVLEDGRRLRVSRTYRAVVESRLRGEA